MIKFPYMKADELRKKFIDFFVSKGHKEIPSVSLVPEDDPTILFTPAGMSPLVRYLMGEPHPLGKRLCSVQKCLRTDDIEEVGDLTHFTFFEMLGNWSLGDYFKKQAIQWSFEFLTDKKWLGLDPKKIYISVFEGDKDASKDKESIKIWQDVFKKVNIEAKEGDWEKPNLDKGERIFVYSKKENWWGPAGQTGPCGPDTEMFYKTNKSHDEKFGKTCHPNCNCGRFFEIWNDVFMQYNKKPDGSFEPLKQKNVDTGMGLERVVALTEYLDGKIKEPDPFLTHLFSDLINQIEELSDKKYENHKKEFRIIADYLRASVFLIADGIEPSNKDRGHVLRRLIRRACDQLSALGVNNKIKRFILTKAVNFYNDEYSSRYKQLRDCQKMERVLLKEVDKYSQMVTKVATVTAKAFITKEISGKKAFEIFSTYGLSPEQLKQEGYQFDQKEFDEEMKKHQKVSRKGMKGKFTGGLHDHSEKIKKLHTTTHLLHSSLRKILGDHVKQIGSNITQERLRFDFTHPKPLTDKEIKKIEELINEQIKKNLKVEHKTMNLTEAQKQGALAFFNQKYPEKVKVYIISRSEPGSERPEEPFSLEVCGGPHIDFTGKLGKFRIKKEESCGSGKRRIYGVLG